LHDTPRPELRKARVFGVKKFKTFREVVLTVLVVAFLGPEAALGGRPEVGSPHPPASLLLLGISFFIMKKISGGHH